MKEQNMPEVKGYLRDFMLTVPQEIYACTGIKILGRRIKSLLFSTDAGIIRNTTADAVEIVVPQLIEKGYTLVTVSELFSIYGTELKPGYYYTNATQEGTLESPFSRN